MAKDKQEPTFTADEFKALQRKLDTARKENLRILGNQLDAQEIKEEIIESRKDFGALIGLLEKSSIFEEEDSVGKFSADQAARAQVRTQAVDARRSLTTALGTKGLTWDDSSVEDARKAFMSGNFADAQTKIEALGGNADDPSGGADHGSEKESDEDFNARVQAEVAKRTKTGAAVDRGDSTGGGAGIPTSAKELVERIRDPNWFKENRKELMAKAKAQGIENIVL